MLKKVRIILSLLLFSLITFFFLDFAGLLPNELHVLEHFQFIPALILAGSGMSIVVIVVLLIITLLFGRIYCSSLCPMGVYQDIAGWLSKRTGRKKKRFHYTKSQTILRWAVVGVIVIAFFAGFTFLLGLLDPYSAYGRMATHVFKPVYVAVNNLLSTIFTRFGIYTFYKEEITLLSAFSLVVALVTFLAIGFMGWRYGRTYCNTICPVGTLLGFVSRFSLFKIRIDDSKCNSCGLCATNCKASCIDAKSKKIDYSRCVDCFNCLDSCKRDSLAFAPYRKKTIDKPAAKSAPQDESKRRFILAGAATTMAATKLFAEKKTSILTNGKSYARQTPISPPGAISAEHLLHHCTSCHLCVTKCPSHVIKPAFMEYGVGGMMQPVMYYEKGFCNYYCTVCADVCPNGALTRLTVEQKQLTQIGRVVFNEEICVVRTDGTNCGACAEHCPTQAVKMVPYRDELTIPSIDTDICIGCGGCEYICPVRPYRAIHVEGNTVHLEAKPFEEGVKKEVEFDFGF